MDRFRAKTFVTRRWIAGGFAGLLACWSACGDGASRPDRGDASAGETAGPQAGKDAGSGGRGSEAADRADAAASDAQTADAAHAADAAIDDGPGRSVTIRFRAKVGDDDFDCDRIYRLPGLGQQVVRDLRFFVQDLSLIDRDGNEVPVRMLERPPGQSAEVAFLDFEPGRGQCSSGTAWMNTSIAGKVPEGDYRGVVFRNGVPEALNHSDPAMFPPPLRDPSMYWDWFQGFRFFVAELGAAYAPGDPSADEDAGVAPMQSLVHIGSVGCRVEGSGIECSIKNRNRVRLPEFDPDRDVIVADIAGVFAGTSSASQTFCHGRPPSCATVYQNTGIDYATGEPATSQRVFRLE